jgi:thymidylate synthase
MYVISSETREEAWLAAVKYLNDEGKQYIDYNLILEIKNPAQATDRSVYIRKEFDNFLTSNGLYSVQTVADTIFPAALYKKHGLKGVFDIYPNTVFPQLRQFNSNNRGTYAMRIVRAKDSQGKEYNPLEYVIERLKSSIANSGPRCATEISVDDSLSIPINRNDKSLYAFPCMSHLSFKLSRDRTELHVTAIYRSQFFIEKAMGNLLGLARLQDCICREIGIKAGALVCHATYATLDINGKKRQFKELLNKLEK